LTEALTKVNRKILVTGGAGFIGSHLVDSLLAEKGNDITVLDNFNDFYSPSIKRANIARHVSNPAFRLVEGDIRDSVAVEGVFASGKFDTVVHLAALAGVRPSLENPRSYYEVNVEGTLNILEAVRSAGVPRFIFGSSSSVYGINEKVPFSEDDTINNTISPYAATKSAGEALCRTFSHLYGIRTVCLRFFTVYGPRQRPDLAIHKFSRKIFSGEPIPVFGDGSTRRDYTYIDDIIQGVRAAMDYSDSMYEIFNLGESQTVQLSELIQEIENALNMKAAIDRQPEQPGDVPITFADISKAHTLLGYRPSVKIKDGIPKFVEWFRDVQAGR
jgi:UDP-glucuronate 4-epimerase